VSLGHRPPPAAALPSSSPAAILEQPQIAHRESNPHGVALTVKHIHNMQAINQPAGQRIIPVSQNRDRGTLSERIVPFYLRTVRKHWEGLHQMPKQSKIKEKPGNIKPVRNGSPGIEMS